MKKIILLVGFVLLVAVLYTALLRGNNIETVENYTEGVVSNKYEINLSHNNLDKIPEYVFKEVNVQRLNVSNNMLSGSIQSQIGQLKNLIVLDASNNKMTGVPAEIGQLQKLEVLDLSNNLLTGLPNELGNLKNLKVLNLAGNQYSKVDLDAIKMNLPADVNIITN